MVFSSLYFLYAFLPLFFLFYFVSGKFFGLRGKNIILFIFSLFFYAWGEPLYVLLLIYSSLLDYCCGLGIGWANKRENPRPGRLFFLCLSLIGNLGLLGIFKYFGFSVLTLNNLFGLSLPVPAIALPIGISFFTFQTMSYTFDVYRGKVKVQRDFLHFGTFVTMFPQLIAGPVVRYADVEHELTCRHASRDDIAAGIRRFLVGLAKKVLVANITGEVVDMLFAHSPAEIGALGSWVAILSYTLQIYFDFSGYSDMAIGLGRMSGFHYPENFNFPYISASVTEFWRRWHITMSTFFRDYVYIPLGGNRVSKWRWVLNIFIVWFLTGLWHGAMWHYVLWGLYFGVLLLLEKIFLLRFLGRSRVLSHLYTLFAIVIGWVIFRCDSVPAIGTYLRAMFGGFGFQGVGEIPAVYLLQEAGVNTVFLLAFLAGVLFSMPVGDFVRGRVGRRAWLGVLGDGALLALLFLATVQLALNAYNPFIYFAF